MPFTPVSRQTLHEALLTSNSATDVLQRLTGLTARAWRKTPDNALLPPASYQLFGAEPLIHREIELRLGATAVSDADLWYSARRLPADMALDLQNSNIPFGQIVRPLNPSRELLEARFGGKESAHALEHFAILHANSQAIALVIERYRWQAISLP